MILVVVVVVVVVVIIAIDGALEMGISSCETVMFGAMAGNMSVNPVKISFYLSSGFVETTHFCG